MVGSLLLLCIVYDVMGLTGYQFGRVLFCYLWLPCNADCCILGYSLFACGCVQVICLEWLLGPDCLLVVTLFFGNYACGGL